MFEKKYKQNYIGQRVEQRWCEVPVYNMTREIYHLFIPCKSAKFNKFFGRSTWYPLKIPRHRVKNQNVRGVIFGLCGFNAIYT